MAVNKKQVVAQLKEAGRLLEVLGEDANRAKAFQSAARQLDAYDGDLERLFAENRLTDIRGIGATLAAELAALHQQGELPALAELKARVPEGVRSLFAVSGLGAKKIAVLWQQGITDLRELLAAAQDGRLAALKGFGKKSAENIAAGAAFALEAAGRYRLDEAEAAAIALTTILPGVRLEVAGALRRCRETIDELEFLTDLDPLELAGLLPPEVADVRIEAAALTGTLAGRPLRFTIAHEQDWGAALAFATGSEAFVAHLRERAAERGYDLDAAGLHRKGQPVPVADEKALFTLLDLPYVTPERREPETGTPQEGLLTLADLRGLVHNHSDWSDGAVSLREMAAAAHELGFAYLATADHSKSSYVAGGLSAERVRAQAREVQTIRAELAAAGSTLELLHGMEVDILPNGELDLPDEVLAELDYCVVSVHQSFGLSEAEQTARIVRAVRNPHAKILGHATGRLLLRRPPYAVDLQAVLDACAESGTIIEINANPRRLDLDWRWVIRARELGCRFSIDPDAHHPSGYDDLRYGVMMARKAGLRPEDVINTAPDAHSFLAQLK